MTDPSRKIRLLMELRRQGIADTEVLSAIEKVPRDEFVPDHMKHRAYENTALPIGSGQTISQPYVVAFMSEALKLTGKRLRVLEIGTGSGYQAAVLSHLCRRVYTIERHKPLLEESERLFERLHLTNITARYGDGYKGWPEAAPFDRILLTAAASKVPQALLDQLSDNGILVAPIGGAGSQSVLRITKTAAGLEEEELLPVRFVPMLPGTDEE